jgi:hypothetical protein
MISTSGESGDFGWIMSLILSGDFPQRVAGNT